MNVNLLIDAIVRQTTVLIAQLATAGGARALLAHTANEVFVNLVRELKDQGLGNKVIADMFGLSLRTYHNKIQRLSESTTDRGRSLWEAVLSHVQEHGPIYRSEVLLRFQKDDVATVRGVLKDLVESGMLYRTGRGDAIVYRAAMPDEVARALAGDQGLPQFLWVVIHRYGPLSLASLKEQVAVDEKLLLLALERLVAAKRVSLTEVDGETLYLSLHCVIPVGAEAGWEAAVFDHYQALVTAIGNKLASGSRSSVPGEWVGGSTFHYDLWQAHPLFDEVVGQLENLRKQARELRLRVEAYNAEHAPDEASLTRVTAYLGQSVSVPEPDDDGRAA
ncbi:MAG TPA: BlaI/MecI/CopY family transcriptional regulator [Polyangiaceae bacterium]